MHLAGRFVMTLHLAFHTAAQLISGLMAELYFQPTTAIINNATFERHA